VSNGAKAGGATGHGFKPGQSGNPGGRAKGLERIFRDELKAIRCRLPQIGDDGIPVLNPDGTPVEYVADGYRSAFYRLWSIVMTGEDKDANVALKILFERTYGAPKQKIVMTEDDDTEDEDDLTGLSVDELRILAKVRGASTPPTGDDGVH